MLTDYLNKKANYIKLSKYKIKNEEDFDKAFIQRFSRKLLTSEDISESAYRHLVSSIAYWKYEDLELEKLSEVKINTLMHHTKLGLSTQNIEFLKQNFSDKHITLIVDFIDDFIKDYNKFDLEADDLAKLLKSNKLSNEHKVLVIKNIDLKVYDDKEELSNITSQIYLKNPQIRDMELFETLFTNCSLENKLRLLTDEIQNFDEEQIIYYFEKLPKPYSDLNIRSARQLKFEEDTINENLLEQLKMEGYIRSYSKKKKIIIVNRKRK